MRLALALGIADVGKLQRSISGPQFAEWLAYYQIEPWGDEPQDLRDAMMVAAATGGKVRDYMVHPEPEKLKRQPIDVMKRTAEEIQKLLGGKHGEASQKP